MITRTFQRRQIVKPAEASLKVIDVKIASTCWSATSTRGGPGAAGDRAARATTVVHRAGRARVGDLSKYDVIVTGVRAYERRDESPCYNRRAARLRAAGGTVIVQIQQVRVQPVAVRSVSRAGQRQPRVGRNRAGDDLVPAIRRSTTRTRSARRRGPTGRRERGCIFSGRRIEVRGPRVDDDSFQDNPGEKLGSLVERARREGPVAVFGLGLWRQLRPAPTARTSGLAKLAEPAESRHREL